MKKEINVDEVENYARELYLGGFSCSEALVAAFVEKLELSVPVDVIKMASGFSGGVGNTGCVCGALSGGVMALGLLFGRSDLESDAMETRSFAKELHDYFKEKAGKKVVCCRILTRGLDLSKGEHKSQCVDYVGMVARKAVEMTAQRLDLVIK